MSLVKGILYTLSGEFYIKDTIKMQMADYPKLREKFPKDSHLETLGKMYFNRMQIRGQKDVSYGEAKFMAEASVVAISALKYPDCTEALGVFFVYEESRDLLIKHRKYLERYNELMKDVLGKEE